jgi:hypothetical protein
MVLTMLHIHLSLREFSAYPWILLSNRITLSKIRPSLQIAQKTALLEETVQIISIIAAPAMAAT